MKKDRLFKAALLSAGCIAGLHTVNRHIYRLATVKKHLTAEENSSFNWHGQNIYYRVHGRGKTSVLLIHDLTPAASGREWKRVVEKLSTKYTVYAIDLPGCGRSDKPHLTYTNFYYAEAIIAFIENVVCRKVHVIASGYSASAAIAAAAYDKTKFSALTVINPPSLEKLSTGPSKKSELARALLQVPVLGTMVYNIIFARARIKKIMKDRYFYNDFLLDESTVEEAYEGAHIGVADGRFLQASLSGRYLNFDIRRILSSLTLPFTIICSTDYAQEEKTAEEYEKVQPKAYTLKIEHVGRYPHLESAPRTLELLFKILEADKNTSAF